jgi:omega-amidase
MKIALIQAELIWQDPTANRHMLQELIRKSEADLVVLPEMFTTGFTMAPGAFAEDMNGLTIQWMKGLAGELQIAITGSIIIYEAGSYYNRLIFVTPEGHVAHYDKRHLFTFAGEDKVYTAGTDRLIVEFRGFSICPMVCYDLRFPVFSRYNGDYDVLLYVANWPDPRIEAWDLLLRARAVENLCYTIGVNRTGTDPHNNIYPGHSAVIDFSGKLLTAGQESTGIISVDISLEPLQDWRNKFGFLEDRDKFEIRN